MIFRQVHLTKGNRAQKWEKDQVPRLQQKNKAGSYKMTMESKIPINLSFQKVF